MGRRQWTPAFRIARSRSSVAASSLGKPQRGVHTSTRQLEADIRAFIEQHNEDPKPFQWTESADDILAAVKRFCLRADQNSCDEL